MLELHSKERKEETNTNKTIGEDQRTKLKIVEDGCLVSNVLPLPPQTPSLTWLYRGRMADVQSRNSRQKIKETDEAKRAKLKARNEIKCQYVTIMTE